MMERQVRRRVGVVMGGSSGERDVSLRSGSAVADALESRGHDVVRIHLGQGSAADFAGSISRARIDVAFLALHGSHGEDGCAQGALELLRVPYTGSGVLASALAMDKLKAKELFRLHNVPTPPYYVVSSADDLADAGAIHGSFGFPVVVKPRSEGSSLGVTKVNSIDELTRAIEMALEWGDTAIVERFVSAMEVDVGLLDGRVLGAIEIVPKSGMYDFEAKYTQGATDYFMPARLSPTRYQNVLNLAERAASALGCTGAVRVDLLVTSGENEYVLEVNTLPGMTPTSLLPKIAKAAGIDFGTLCETILDGARLHTTARRRTPVRAQPVVASEGLRLVKSVG